MKKLLLKSMIISFLASGALFSYTIKINNTTDSVMSVDIDYVSSDLCSPDRLSISPHSAATVNARGCCTKPNVKFEAKSGSLEGAVTFYNPSRSGLGISCKGWKAEIKPGAEAFSVETR